MKFINEETRTVSGFTEFIHNGKTSIMEDTPNEISVFDKKTLKNFHNAHSIVFSEYVYDFYNFCVSIDNMENKKDKSIAFNSFIKLCFEDNKNIFNDKITNITKGIYLYKLNINEPFAYGGYFIINNTGYIFISKINLSGEKSIEKYNAIIDIIAEKKLSKMPHLKIIGTKEMVNEKFFEKYKQSEDNPNIFIYDNPFYIKNNNKTKKEDNDEKTAFNRENKVKEPKDTISTDKSSLIDKKEKKKKEDNSNSIVKSAAHGYQKGINAANSNANFLKTIYNAYKEEKNKNKSYF